MLKESHLMGTCCSRTKNHFKRNCSPTKGVTYAHMEGTFKNDGKELNENLRELIVDMVMVQSVHLGPVLQIKSRHKRGNFRFNQIQKSLLFFLNSCIYNLD